MMTDVSISGRSSQELSPQKPTPVQHPDSDSTKSPGSTSEEESTTRPRTKFTTEQLAELENIFKEHRYIGSSEKKRLSKVLKLSEIQIKTWFQNRRMKLKRQNHDARPETVYSGLYLPYYNYSDFQQPGCSVRPEFALPLPPPAPIHPYGALPTPVVRPAFPAPPIPPPNFEPYPCPPMVLHPMLNDPLSHRYTTY